MARTDHPVVFSGLEYRPDYDFVMSVGLPAASAICVLRCLNLVSLQGTLEVTCLLVQNICVLVAPYRRSFATGPVSRSWYYYARFILSKCLKSLIVCPQATGFEHVDVQKNECGLCF